MNDYAYSKMQFWSLYLLRLAIGWHFLYEGLVKILNPRWTSMGYLMDAQGFAAEFYHEIAKNPVWLEWANNLNMAGLTAIGLSLIVGCLVNWASIAGILMLLLYYLSHIPGLETSYLLPSEGSYLWIDKNIIEMLALWVIIAFPTSKIVGIDKWLYAKKRN